MDFFSSTYFESREKFAALVPRAGGVHTTLTHPHGRGPRGETLTVDVGVFGSSQAPKVFFNINGVHGNESYSGGAAQLQWMASGALGKLPSDICVVLIHDLNPYGWAFDSQLNEDLFNLNRNFMDFDRLPPADALHDAMAEAIAIKAPSLGALADASKRLWALADTFGEVRFNAAVLDGQYSAPRGLNYGGSHRAWSNIVLLDLAAEHLKAAKKVVILDWHTGLGGYGEPYPIHTWTEGSESWRRTALMWGEEAVRLGACGVVNRGAAEGDAPADALRGLAIKAVFDTAPEAVFAGGVFEFGTAPWEVVAEAVILDQWLMFEGPTSGVDLRFWRAFVRAAFAPREQEWETSVLAHAPGIYQRMLDGLCEW